MHSPVYISFFVCYFLGIVYSVGSFDFPDNKQVFTGTLIIFNVIAIDHNLEPPTSPNVPACSILVTPLPHLNIQNFTLHVPHVP